MIVFYLKAVKQLRSKIANAGDAPWWKDFSFGTSLDVMAA